MGNQENYSEGIYVGYRWYDKEQTAPLFPFGHGLSVTSFAYRDLAVRRQSHGGLTVSFTLKNTGTPRRRRGSPRSTSARARGPPSRRRCARSAATRKCGCAPGQSTTVRIRVDAQQLKYWNTSSHSWVLGTGKRDVWVGSSSRTLPLQGSVGVGR
ncbi:fibronectin type III-like domain-contianing protein [Streptomyces sp. L7]